MKTLSDVLDQEDVMISKLIENGNVENPGYEFFDSVRMDAVLVLDDILLRKYLEYLYCYDTHIAPHCLPAVGMTVGDIVEIKGQNYLTINGMGMSADVIASQMFRQHEEKSRQWIENYDKLNQKILEFMQNIHKLDMECFGVEEFSSFTYIGSHIASFEVDLPSLDFVKALYAFSERCELSSKVGSDILDRAHKLALELEPYLSLLSSLKKIKKEVGHKGFPGIKDSLIQFNTPATSAAAVMHSCIPNDKLDYSSLSSNSLMLIAAQAGNLLNTMHIGAGSIKGEHYFMHPPRSEFFTAVQGKFDGDSDLKNLWQDRDYSLFEGDIQAVAAAAMEWRHACLDAKCEVIKDVVPGIVSGRVLGDRKSVV